MAEKQSQLNGAYYGPAVPPTRSYHRHGRGSSCGCCCLLSLIAKLIVSVVVILGLAALIFWLIFRPINKINVNVTDASLSQFNLTSDNNLHYNLALNITVRNPNKKIGIYYDQIEANAYYENLRFATLTVPPFYQGYKNTTYLNPVFSGQQLMVLGADAVSEYKTETSAGVYEIDLKLKMKIRFKLGRINTWRFKPTMDCDLKVPLGSSGGAVSGDCDLHLW